MKMVFNNSFFDSPTIIDKCSPHYHTALKALLEELKRDLGTLPQSITEAAELKDWLKENDPADFLDEPWRGHFLAAKRHNPVGDIIAMQENAKIVHAYERQAFQNAKAS